MAHFLFCLSRHLQALVPSHFRCSLFSSEQSLSSLISHSPSHLHPTEYSCSLYLSAFSGALCCSRNHRMVLELRQKTLWVFPCSADAFPGEVLQPGVGVRRFGGAGAEPGGQQDPIPQACSQFLCSWRDRQPWLTNPGCLWQRSIILIWILTPCLSLQS